MANTNTAVMGKTKRSTDNMIDDAIAQQDSWLARRRSFTRRFLRRRNSTIETTNTDSNDTPKTTRTRESNNRSVVREYWFPIVCAFIVLLVTIWVLLMRSCAPQKVIVLNSNLKPVPVETVSKGTVKKISEPTDIPTFDIARIQSDGLVVIAGRWRANKSVSILVNNKIVATESTNENGEFVYSPKLNPGNYTISAADFATGR